MRHGKGFWPCRVCVEPCTTLHGTAQPYTTGGLDSALAVTGRGGHAPSCPDPPALFAGHLELRASSKPCPPRSSPSPWPSRCPAGAPWRASWGWRGLPWVGCPVASRRPTLVALWGRLAARAWAPLAGPLGALAGGRARGRPEGGRRGWAAGGVGEGWLVVGSPCPAASRERGQPLTWVRRRAAGRWRGARGRVGLVGHPGEEPVVAWGMDPRWIYQSPITRLWRSPG